MYIVDINKISEDGRLLLENDSYDWMGAALLVTVRAVLTIIIEIGVAFLFKSKGKINMRTDCNKCRYAVISEYQSFMEYQFIWYGTLYCPSVSFN